MELDPQEREIKSRDVELDPQEREIKSREVELDSQEREIKSREVELDSQERSRAGRWSWALEVGQLFASVVPQQLLYRHRLWDFAPHSC